jgi:hypothetical protein
VPNSLNISSNGDPGGNSKGKGFDCVVTVVVVEILTTDGITLSAKSANDDGISLALPEKEILKTVNKTIIDLKYFFIFSSTK